MNKFVRFIYEDAVCYGRLNGEIIHFLSGNFLDHDSTETQVCIPLSHVRLLSPLDPPNVLCIGLNYRSHAEESEMEVPDHPLIFLKTTTAVTGPDMPILLPAMAPKEVDYEGELAIVIGKQAKNVSIEDALDYVFGYTIANDVSARDCQLKEDAQWARGKSFDTFCPLGPAVATDLDPLHLSIKTRVNGQLLQDGNTEDMIFSVPALVSFCSRAMTLLPGTVILSGTPDGVGFKRIPPVFLKDQDLVEIEIEGLGVLKNPVTLEG